MSNLVYLRRGQVQKIRLVKKQVIPMHGLMSYAFQKIVFQFKWRNLLKLVIKGRNSHINLLA